MDPVESSSDRPQPLSLRRRFYSANPPAPPRRTKKSGTEAELNNLGHRFQKLKNQWSYHHHIKKLKQRNQIQEYDEAERAFANGDYGACHDKAFHIIAVEPSETIKAKAYMLLAKPEVTVGSPSEREYYADLAMTCWDIVINRSGYCQSRYPIEEARKQRDIAEELLEDAQLDQISIQDTEDLYEDMEIEEEEDSQSTVIDPALLSQEL